MRSDVYIYTYNREREDGTVLKCLDMLFISRRPREKKRDKDAVGLIGVKEVREIIKKTCQGKKIPSPRQEREGKDCVERLVRSLLSFKSPDNDASSSCTLHRPYLSPLVAPSGRQKKKIWSGTRKKNKRKSRARDRKLRIFIFVPSFPISCRRSEDKTTKTNDLSPNY